jgi:glyoxylase-like metal-dependent hydrolase (beta-lactamase superfamily II)
LECNSSIVKGSPATLIVSCGGDVYVVDPGHGRKRAKQIRGEILKHEPQQVTFLVTHFHSDHHTSISGGLLDSLRVQAVVVAPAADAPAVRDPLIRVTLTFGYPIPEGSSLLTYDPLPVRVDSELDPPASLGPLEVVPLPGHTPGQVGVVAPDGVFYAADSLFGDRVLARFGAPYHFNPCKALETLEWVRDNLGRFEALQPSHGPLLKASDAGSLVEANINAVSRLLDLVREALERRYTLDEATRHVAKSMSAPGDPGLLLLIQATVRGAITCLHARGEADAIAEDGLVRWRSRP